MTPEERKYIDNLIDKLYQKMDECKYINFIVLYLFTILIMIYSVPIYIPKQFKLPLKRSQLVIANNITDVGTFLNNEGSGLYRLERCINHSCVPNAECTFPNGDFTLSLVATRAIAAGEEICISYLDDCQLERSKHSRNKHLRLVYFLILTAFSFRVRKTNLFCNHN